MTGWSCLSFEEHNTLLVEVEGIVNARPLTYVYDDLYGIKFALTALNFINGRRLQILLTLASWDCYYPRTIDPKISASETLTQPVYRNMGERITWSGYMRLAQRVQGEPETLKLLLVTWHCFTMIHKECALETSDRKGIVTMEWRQNKSSGCTSSRFKDLVEEKYQALNSYWSEIERGHVNRTWWPNSVWRLFDLSDTNHLGYWKTQSTNTKDLLNKQVNIKCSSCYRHLGLSADLIA